METFSSLLALCVGNFTGNSWIPLTKASDKELWCFLWSATEQTVESVIKTLVIWDAIVLIMTSVLWDINKNAHLMILAMFLNKLQISKSICNQDILSSLCRVYVTAFWTGYAFTACFVLSPHAYNSSTQLRYEYIMTLKCFQHYWPPFVTHGFVLQGPGMSTSSALVNGIHRLWCFVSIWPVTKCVY